MNPFIQHVKELVGGNFLVGFAYTNKPTGEHNLHGHPVTERCVDPNCVVVAFHPTYAAELDEDQLCSELVRLADILMDAGLLPRIHLTTSTGAFLPRILVRK